MKPNTTPPPSAQLRTLHTPDVDPADIFYAIVEPAGDGGRSTTAEINDCRDMYSQFLEGRENLVPLVYEMARLRSTLPLPADDYFGAVTLCRDMSRRYPGRPKTPTLHTAAIAKVAVLVAADAEALTKSIAATSDPSEKLQRAFRALDASVCAFGLAATHTHERRKEVAILLTASNQREEALKQACRFFQDGGTLREADAPFTEALLDMLEDIEKMPHLDSAQRSVAIADATGILRHARNKASEDLAARIDSRLGVLSSAAKGPSLNVSGPRANWEAQARNVIDNLEHLLRNKELVAQYRDRATDQLEEALGGSSEDAKKAQRWLQRFVKLVESSAAYDDSVKRTPAEIQTRLDAIKHRLNTEIIGNGAAKEKALDIALLVLEGNSLGSIQVYCGVPGTGKSTMAAIVSEELFGADNVTKMHFGLKAKQPTGHESTFTGSKPGPWANALTRARGRQPCYFLDEIDKDEESYNDIASHLGKQDTVTDPYFDFPLDNDHAAYVCVLNKPDLLSEHLGDRVNGNIAEFKALTASEKEDIARLAAPRILKAAGCPEIHFSEEALQYVIARYRNFTGARLITDELEVIAKGVATARFRNPSLRIVTPMLAQRLVERSWCTQTRLGTQTTTDMAAIVPKPRNGRCNAEKMWSFVSHEREWQFLLDANNRTCTLSMLSGNPGSFRANVALGDADAPICQVQQILLEKNDPLVMEIPCEWDLAKTLGSSQTGGREIVSGTDMVFRFRVTLEA